MRFVWRLVRTMRMLMMCIMDMPVFVIQWIMQVSMFMLFSEMQVYARCHQCR